MKIAIVGSRGVPANYGGFETFAEEISINLSKNYGYSLSVVCDANQRKLNRNLKEYRGVKLLYSKYSKSKNPLLFYYDSIKRAVLDSDIIYSCGPAGGVFAYLVHKNGKVLITNPDGLNWKRAKWNRLVRLAFRSFEFMSAKFSDYIACDSYGIETHIKSSYRVDNTFVIEYGAYPNPYIDRIGGDIKNTLDKYNLTPFSYHLVVSRLEPENHIDTIIRGYLFSKRKYPLIVIGAIKDTKYIRYLQSLSNGSVIFLGGVYDKRELQIIRANALDYLHGHSVGGTNPSLLEAMASRNLCICHDNIFNREVVGECGLFFRDERDINNYLNLIELNPIKFKRLQREAYKKIISYYNWDFISHRYHSIFKKISQSRFEHTFERIKYYG